MVFATRLVLGLVLAQAAGICAPATPGTAPVATGGSDAGCEPTPVRTPQASLAIHASADADGELRAGKGRIIKDGSDGVAIPVAFTGTITLGTTKLVSSTGRGLAVLRTSADGTWRPSAVIELGENEPGTPSRLVMSGSPLPDVLVAPIGDTGAFAVAFPLKTRAVLPGTSGPLEVKSTGGYDTVIAKFDDHAQADWVTTIQGAGHAWPTALDASGDLVWVAVGARGATSLADGRVLDEGVPSDVDNAFLVGLTIDEAGTRRAVKAGAAGGSRIGIDEPGVHVTQLLGGPEGSVWAAGEYEAGITIDESGVHFADALSAGGSDVFVLKVPAKDAPALLHFGGPGDEAIAEELARAGTTVRAVVDHAPQFVVEGARSTILFAGDDFGTAEITIDEGGVHVTSVERTHHPIRIEPEYDHRGAPAGNGRHGIRSPRDPQSGLPTGQRIATSGSLLWASSAEAVLWVASRDSDGFPTGSAGLTWLQAVPSNGGVLALASINLTEPGGPKSRLVAFSIGEPGVQ